MKERFILDQLKEVIWPVPPFSLEGRMVMVVRRGSEAHGTFIPSTDANGIDDRDLLGVVIPPPKFYLGVETKWEKQETQEINGPWDVLLYDIRKFVRLLMAQNPNLLTALWAEQEDYLYMHPLGQWLISLRDILKAREAFHAASTGYAKGQLHKMTHHEMPTGYMGEKRKKLVEKVGYDAKNAAHMFRLLAMATEFHTEGVLHTRRTKDAEFLKAVKTGTYSLEDIGDLAGQAFEVAERAYQNSVLPEQGFNPDELSETLAAKVLEFLR